MKDNCICKHDRLVHVKDTTVLAKVTFGNNIYIIIINFHLQLQWIVLIKQKQDINKYIKKKHLSAKIFFLAVFMESVKVLRPDIFEAFVKIRFLFCLIKVFHASHIHKAFAYTVVCVDSYVPYPLENIVIHGSSFVKVP